MKQEMLFLREYNFFLCANCFRGKLFKEKKAQPKLAGNKSYTRRTIVLSNGIVTQNLEKSNGFWTKKAGRSVESDTIPTLDNIPQAEPPVKKVSLEEKKQQETLFFKRI